MPRGVKKAKPWTEALEICAMEPAAGQMGLKGFTRLMELAETTFTLAKKGDMQAIKEIGDRLEGRPVQQTVLAGDPEAPLQVLSDKPLSEEDWAVRYGTAANQD